MNHLVNVSHIKIKYRTKRCKSACILRFINDIDSITDFSASDFSTCSSVSGTQCLKSKKQMSIAKKIVAKCERKNLKT